MQAPWRIELLGWLRAESDGHAVTRFSTHQTAALLARLALWPRRAHAREELADLLWPDAPSEAARASLRQALTSLRHQLEPPGVPAGSVLIADRTHIRLNPSAISTDVAEFEAALRSGNVTMAQGLYKGELLPGYYEDWVLDERARLEALFEQIESSATVTHTALAASAPSNVSAATSDVSHSHTPAIRLPMQFTRFFGRTEELAQIATRLADYRLVTLTGPGGAGKTRLSIEAGRRLAETCRVVFVALADVVPGADIDRLTESVADSLQLARDDGTRPRIERVVEALSSQPTLLVLDNAEHVAVPTGQLIQTLLSRVPHLRALVASRRRLHVAGERELLVPPLPTPADGDHAPEEIARIAAVQLFTDRAQAVRPDFQLTPRNAADVAMLCRRLEGAPLAIELAAARAATLTPAQMLVHLEQRFEFLATRRTDKDARHRSLWAAISWSVDLLPESLGRFWNRLAVFRGGFTAEAATALTGEKAALECLTQLRERSLIATDECDDEMRFRLLESLREFAQLEWDADERRNIEDRHGAYFLDLARTGAEAVRGSEQTVWLQRLEREHDNLRAALTHGEAHGDAAFTQQLAGELWGFWERHGHLAEARRWLERALALPGPIDSASRALALNRLGAILNYSGTLDEVAAVHQETLDTYRRIGDERGIALAYSRLGMLANRRGDKEGARDAFTEALMRERTLGNRFNVASAAINLGILAQSRKSYDEAHAFYAEGLELFRALKNPAGIADTQLNIAALFMAENRWDKALPLMEEAGAGFDRIGDRWSRAYADYALALIARHQDRWDNAASLATDALVVCREVGDKSKAADVLLHLGVVARHAGDDAGAIGRFREALALNRELGRDAAAAECKREISGIGS